MCVCVRQSEIARVAITWEQFRRQFSRLMFHLHPSEVSLFLLPWQLQTCNQTCVVLQQPEKGMVGLDPEDRDGNCLIH